MDKEKNKKERAKDITSNNTVVGKRVNNGAVKVMKAGWGRDENGELVLPEGRVSTTTGWHCGLTLEEKERVIAHNSKCVEKDEREIFAEQNRKNSKYTAAQRISHLANSLSLQLVNELEARPLAPLIANNRKSIMQRREAIAAYTDTIKFHRLLIEHKEMIAKETDDKSPPTMDGVTNIDDVRKKLREIKRSNGASEE